MQETSVSPGKRIVLSNCMHLAFLLCLIYLNGVIYNIYSTVILKVLFLVCVVFAIKQGLNMEFFF